MGQQPNQRQDLTLSRAEHLPISEGLNPDHMSECSIYSQEEGFNFDYKWIVTKDLSLTLKSTTSPDSEWMHSLHGAYSESQYIYGEALRLALKDFDRTQTLNVFSMGLGLGYLEMMALFDCAKVDQKVNIYSFELDPNLQQLFKIQWDLFSEFINHQKFLAVDNFQSQFNVQLDEFKKGYFDFFLKDYDQDIILQGLKNQQAIKHFGPFDSSSMNALDIKFHVIFYDAFSSSTQNELWSDNFLSAFLQEVTDPNFCVFSTYAKVGALKRNLKAAHFDLHFKKGFAFKRESTLALRSQKK